VVGSKPQQSDERPKQADIHPTLILRLETGELSQGEAGSTNYQEKVAPPRQLGLPIQSYPNKRCSQEESGNPGIKEDGGNQRCR